MGYDGNIIIKTKEREINHIFYSPDKQGLLHIITEVLDDYDVVELDVKIHIKNK